MGTPRFTPEFKEEAVRQITERGYSVAEASDLAHSLYKWLRAIKPDNSEHLISPQYQYIFNGYNM